jgi:hypothetical protein
MKGLTIILFLSLTISSFGQGRIRQMKISEIKKSFPYNKTEVIKLVSFKYDYPIVNDSDTAEVEIKAYEPETPRSNGKIDMTEMFEVKTLDNAAEEELMRILMNYDHQDTNKVAFCYEPRNGIVFLDKDEQIIGYIEICFECLRFKTEPSTVTISTLFPDEFAALKSFFRKSGIIYGTSDTRDK